MNLHFTHKEKIDKGWSGDLKYRVTDEVGKDYLLRIYPNSDVEKKKLEYDKMLEVSELGVPMCIPLEFGTCVEGPYSIQFWIDGEDAEQLIPLLPETQQYCYGLDAGKALQKIHSIPAPAEQPDWEDRFNRKMDYKIQKYLECPIKYEGGEAFIEYIHANRHLLKDRPQCFQHGDYHIGNMMIDRAGMLQSIDFNRYDFGDPWEEFNRIVCCAQASPWFATGLVDGYFDGQVPEEFWRLLALYISSNCLSSIYWAVPFGQGEVDTMVKQGTEVLQWYEHMKNPVPSWYQREFYLEYVDGIAFRMKQSFDFSFLQKYGKVIKVFDEQDSGNICFGVEKDGQRYFIKFAGAPTACGDGDTVAAVERLKATVPVYQELRHKNLIEYISSEEIGGGFAMVFRWTDARCMGRMYPNDRKRFLELSLAEREDVFREIMEFMTYTASKGYLAVDFYDGSIMYDFEQKKTIICDIDFFRKLPTQNDMGRMWGSSLFMAPEEYQLGADLDEVTNVYTLGAVAFALFSDFDRSQEKWRLSAARYQTVTKATNPDRSKRQQTIRQFMEEWE